MKKVKVKDLETGEIQVWTIEQVLFEINRDRSADWTPYDESDWEEGWREWCEGDYYTMLEIMEEKE